MKIKSFSILLFIASCSSIFAQVNTEKLRLFGDREGWTHSLQASANIATGNANFTRISGSWRSDFERKPWELMFVANFEQGSGSGKVFLNKGFVHIRGMYRLKAPLKLEAFVQEEFNDFIRIKRRELEGVGLRWKAIASTPKSEKTVPYVWLYFGTGLMHEKELSKDGSAFDTKLLRSTNYLTFYLDYGKNISFNTVHYFQIALKDISDYRLLSEGSLSIGLSKKLALTTAFTYRYDHQPPNTLKPSDFNLTQGFRLTF